MAQGRADMEVIWSYRMGKRADVAPASSFDRLGMGWFDRLTVQVYSNRTRSAYREMVPFWGLEKFARNGGLAHFVA